MCHGAINAVVHLLQQSRNYGNLSMGWRVQGGDAAGTLNTITGQSVGRELHAQPQLRELTGGQKE